MRYSILIQNKEKGPFTIQELTDMFLEGKIGQDNPCCPENGKKFEPLRIVVPEVTGGRHSAAETREKVAATRPPPQKPVLLTTETYLPDLSIQRRLEVVTAECVFGMNIFKDFFAGVSDIFGGRNRSTQKGLRDARNKVLEELKEEARLIGANAVIAVDIDYSEFTGQGKSMLFVVASGTAVKIKPEIPKA